MIPGIGIVQINVTDLETARRFYEDIIGFEPLGGDNQALCYKLKGETVLLLYKVDMTAENHYPNGTGVVPVFYVENIDRFYTGLNDKQVDLIKVPWSKESSGIGPCPFGRFIGVRDPFGNVFEILQPWPEKQKD